MAYDPKDAADKKIVDGLIAEALEKQAEEHETATEGLKAKNVELVAKLKKAREGQGDPAAVETLERELETTKTALTKSEKDLKAAIKERDTFKSTAETSSKAHRDLLVENGLTNELASCNVAQEFMPAVKSLLGGKIEVKDNNGKQDLVVGDKSLGDFVKSWSQGDEGKIYIKAPVNGGGAAPGSKAPGSIPGKTMPRSQFDGLDQLGRANFAKEGGKVVDG